ncbi:MAG: hypothetical protein B7Z66_03825 [Chromatiales bacterium 21-64-14]|nr:MAG: hypothetical protein B7Z66_03825 [Chromatiales bacterium 21-64-14]HQU14792.1 phenylpyruvate tautomerase MIF-related protein [Gammaproteobacteria bacterium]
MPYLKVQTNVAVARALRTAFVEAASSQVAAALGKPERYVMVALEPETTMAFAGTDAPLAYLELKSIGLPQSATRGLSEMLCALVHSQLDIDPQRVYIEFIDAPRTMWGWNGDTF